CAEPRGGVDGARRYAGCVGQPSAHSEAITSTRLRVSNPEYSSGPNGTTAAPVSEERASVWEDFIDIFFAPANVFRRREHGSWVLPMLVVTLALTILGFTNSGVLTPM